MSIRSFRRVCATLNTHAALGTKARPMGLCAAAVCLSSLMMPLVAVAQPLPVTPYLSFNDSPFSSITFDTFHLETFEDGLLNTPGLAITSNLANDILGVFAPSSNTDSVDGDDGAIDGFGRNGHSLFSVNNLANESAGITLTFSRDALGWLPTHVGLVWTDGTGGRERVVQFFDEQGGLLGTQSAITGDGSFSGSTAEDRFFGGIFAQGVARMTFRAPQAVNGLEIDHVQYGIIPAPSAAALLSLGGLLAARRRR